MEAKTSEVITLLGAALSALLLFLQSLGLELTWFTDKTIELFVNSLIATATFSLTLYGVYKNTYVLTKKARKQNKVLQDKGLK